MKNEVKHITFSRTYLKILMHSKPTDLRLAENLLTNRVETFRQEPRQYADSKFVNVTLKLLFFLLYQMFI